MSDDIGNVTNVILSRTLSLRCHMRSQWRGVPSSRHPAAEKIRITNPQSWWSSLSDIAISTLQRVPEKRWTDFWGLCWQTRFLAKVAQTDLRGPKTRSSNKQIDRPQNCVYQLFWDPLQRMNNKTTYIEFFAKMTPTYPNTSLCLQCLPRQPWGFIFSYQSFLIMVHIFLSKLCDHCSYFLITTLWFWFIFSYRSWQQGFCGHTWLIIVIMVHIFSSKLTTRFVLTHIIAS